MDRRVCYTCGRPGHISRFCPGEPTSSSSSSFSSQNEINYPFFDSHCHLETLIDRNPNLKLQSKFGNGFRGCISSFSDPAALSPSLSNTSDILSNFHPFVWASFGCHPHHAKVTKSSFFCLLKKIVILCCEKT
jgi:hypothetical protein